MISLGEDNPPTDTKKLFILDEGGVTTEEE